MNATCAIVQDISKVLYNFFVKFCYFLFDYITNVKKIYIIIFNYGYFCSRKLGDHISEVVVTQKLKKCLG